MKSLSAASLKGLRDEGRLRSEVPKFQSREQNFDGRFEQPAIPSKTAGEEMDGKRKSEVGGGRRRQAAGGMKRSM